MTLTAYLVVAAALFGVGLYGLVQRRSLARALIAFELMLAAVVLNLLAFASLAGRESGTGQVVALVLVGVAASRAVATLAHFAASQRETGRSADE